jgi:hypothetical protein
MNSLVLDAPTMTTEPQMRRDCTTFTLDSTIKIDAVCAIYFKLAQCFFDHCANLQYCPYIIITGQTRYCAINIAGAPLVESSTPIFAYTEF